MRNENIVIIHLINDNIYIKYKELIELIYLIYTQIK